jgi:hypothetical protein
VKVIGLLSWYAEQADHLTAAIESLAANGVDHLIAVDGAYALFPDARGASEAEQHDAVRETAYTAGMACTIHTPARPWAGNEVEKRTMLFRLGSGLAAPREDWLFVVDADETIVEAGDWRAQLEQTPHDVASIQHGEPGVRPRLERRLFRAHPKGIRVALAHFYYLDGDERVLWGPGQIERDIVDLRILHQPLKRTKERNERRNGYYENRLMNHAEPAVA